MEAEVSSRMRSCVLVSPRYRFRKQRSVLAKTFQSTWRRSSPAVKARYWATPGDTPTPGDRCIPATNPSTTVFATKSREEMEARVAGSRNRWSISGGVLPPRRRGDAERNAEDWERCRALPVDQPLTRREQRHRAVLSGPPRNYWR